PGRILPAGLQPAPLDDPGWGHGTIPDQDAGSQTPHLGAQGLPTLPGHLSDAREKLQGAASQHRAKGQKAPHRAMGSHPADMEHQGPAQGGAKRALAKPLRTGKTPLSRDLRVLRNNRKRRAPGSPPYSGAQRPGEISWPPQARMGENHGG